jgi:catechol 2,3-dioxygenase-like lactoylglutathione lyase family enzyme
MKPKLKRVLYNVLAKDLETSANFYRRIANFEEVYTSDWYVVMKAPGIAGLEIGLIDQVSQFTPRHAWGMHEGAYLTLVVDDVFLALEVARELGVEIIEEPVALDYGQTRALIRDPNGMVIDISTPTEELAARQDVEFEPSPKTTAIDQAQPEERDGPQTLA